jgi:ATP-binding cassette, subfamily B, bacterial CvaB/MchF/RaxB
VDGRGATIHDPARGERRLSLAELSRHFTGVALEFEPDEGFRAQRRRARLPLRSLLGPVHGLRSAFAQVIVLALVLEGFVLLTPFFMQWVVDEVLVSADRELLVALGVGFVLLVAFQAATAALRSWAVLAMSASLNRQWLTNVFAHLLRLPLVWFERRQLGDVWSRFLSVQAIQRTLTTSFVEALLDGVMVLLTLAVMAWYSLPLLGIALVATLAYALLRRAFYRPLRDASEEALVFEGRQNGSFVETLRGMQAIKLFNAQSQRRQLFSAQVSETMNAQLATRSVEAGFAVLHRLLFGLERVAVIWLGALLVLDRQLTVGMLLAFFAYKEQFSLRVAALIDKSVELAMLSLQAERLADIVLEPPEDTSSFGKAFAESEQPPTIELRDLRFRHSDNEPEVLRGVNLRIEPGESLAIVGPSGCGKSTLIKVLLGLLPPGAGDVLIDGLPLSRVGVSSWRRRVGCVMQDDQLFSGSIAANIAFFAPDADLDRVEQCARMAAVHADIEAMPMGYQTLIGDMGSSLSGGQKQRILLARALYPRPQVLVLDEATSALDVDGERGINETLRTLLLTRIVVAHRPEAIAAAGRVVALHDGRVAQDLRSVPLGTGSG